ncbi:serine/threonine protein kinase [Wenjunlia tyrosinilytica]|uniref:non-specific serine/threonine protein kinase n=1 Tax=Wenjunlia tyrosinilytica TaxID=1544741 RepID=A0A917ZFK6_9ACTN|nr:serine/threonine protein kinase [Wenjunlia tyrosinilytica]
MKDPSPAFGQGDPIIGRTLDGRYRVEGRVAVGGMATVYRAVDTRLDRLLALKVMHPGLASDPGFVDRFIREAKAVARLDHPNVVGVYDQGTDGTYVFLAMEYVAGCTLRDVLRERGALQPRAALDILEPVLAALGAAHRSGLVHRDVKPENVLIGNDGRVKVADFGLVRAVDTNTTSTTMGSVLGTVSYLAPEQIEHGTVDARSDVYACGVLLYEMLTGSKPHEGGTPMQVIYKHLNEDITAPSKAHPGLAPELDQLVARASARDAQRRPGDAIELLAFLQATRRALTDEQLDAAAPAAPLDDAAATGAAAAGSVRSGAAGDEDRTTLIPRPVASPAQAPGTAAAAFSQEPLNRTSRLQLPPELVGRRAEPAAHTMSGPPPRSRFRERRGLIGLITVLAVALTVGAVAWFIGEGRYTTTPSVLRMTQAQAQKHLDKAGLEARFTKQFSETIPAGRVISTDPANGSRVRGGSTVKVALSSGPERIAVPEVEGETLADAKREIRDAGLTVGTLGKEFSDSVPEGQVVSTDPEVGSAQKPDTPVSIVISKGEPVDVPDVVGRDLDDARADLEDKGLTMEIAPEEVFSDEVDKGAVAAQTPEDGNQAVMGSTVTVTISKGPQLFEVPDVMGKDKDKAQRKLEEAGFKVDITDTVPLFGDDKVWRQSPDGGSEEPKGTTINLWVR